MLYAWLTAVVYTLPGLTPAKETLVYTGQEKPVQTCFPTRGDSSHPAHKKLFFSFITEYNE